MENEVWRNINEEGFENLYQVSNLGRGRSLDRYVTHNKGGLRLMKGKIMGQHKDARYLFMALTALDHTHINRHYHLLIAKAFPEICGEWFEGAVVHHKDFNPYNNRADNLQVMTAEEHKLLHSQDEESKQKKSEATKKWLKENGHPLKGTHLSDETKKKISKANKKYTDEELKAHKKEYIDKNREKYRDYWHNYYVNVKKKR